MGDRGAGDVHYAGPMTTIRWREGAPWTGGRATCPACGDCAGKPVILEVGTLGLASRTITLVACQACELRFFPDLGAPASFADVEDVAARRMFELGIGLHGSVECLGRLERPPGRRMLEVGCGTGLTLDWAGRVLGWEVLGVDTSAVSALTRDELGVPVVNGLLGETAEVEPGVWDVVFASEVIEHVTDPAKFLAAIRSALAPGGTFVLRTPAAESLAPGHDPSAMLATLSPGYHAMLHTAASLEATLRRAGFSAVAVCREGDTLHAGAATGRLDWDADGKLSEREISDYLRDRVETLEIGSATRLGLLQQLVNVALNADDRPLGDWAEPRLDATLRARYGRGLDADPAGLPPGSEPLYAAAFHSTGMWAARRGERGAAIERLRAAADAGARASAALLELNAYNEGIDRMRQSALLQALVLAGDEDPAAAGAELEALLGEPGPERRSRVLELFVRSLATDSPRLAARLAGEVGASLDEGPSSDPLEREARWALAMYELHSGEAPAAAAGHFALAAREAADPDRRWSATFHEGYALWHADRVGPACERLRVVADAPPGPDGPAGEWRDHAQRLLAKADARAAEAQAG
jgi:SAM-dependent methyltransferase